jgi:hypothetical protein
MSSYFVVQGVDVQAILQGSTGMIQGSGSGNSGMIDTSTTTQLLKHLNISPKPVTLPGLSLRTSIHTF